MSIFDLRLETERLLLRPPQAGDFEAWASFLADEQATRYIGGVQVRPLAWRSFATMFGAWHLQGFGFFSVIEKATGQWVGRLGPWQPEGWPGTEVGWSIVRDQWGRGFAPEGAAAATDWAFEALGWAEVIHSINPANENSQAVARKLGSSFMRMDWLPAPHDSEPVEIWGHSRTQWRERRESRGRA